VITVDAVVIEFFNVIVIVVFRAGLAFALIFRPVYLSRSAVLVVVVEPDIDEFGDHAEIFHVTRALDLAYVPLHQFFNHFFLVFILLLFLLLLFILDLLAGELGLRWLRLKCLTNLAI
jgi:hypothetical protein